MSGKTKRNIYHFADFCLFVLFGLGSLFLPVFLRSRSADLVLADFLFYAAALVLFVFGFPAFLHECGHLLFGLLAGMKLARFGFHCFPKGTVAGETAMYPKNGKHVKGKFTALTLGGATMDLVAAAALLLLWLLLPYHPALLFCGTLSGPLFYEGVRALLPAELPAGKTDGAVLSGLLKHRPEEEVMLRVLTAQGILFRGDFSDIPEALLFEAPVVREDLPIFAALSLLRVQWLLAAGREGEAESLMEDLLPRELSEEARPDLMRYAALFGGDFRADEAVPLQGVRALEARLEGRFGQKK